MSLVGICISLRGNNFHESVFKALCQKKKKKKSCYYSEFTPFHLLLIKWFLDVFWLWETERAEYRKCPDSAPRARQWEMLCMCTRITLHPVCLVTFYVWAAPWDFCILSIRDFAVIRATACLRKKKKKAESDMEKNCGEVRRRNSLGDWQWRIWWPDAEPDFPSLRRFCI